MHHLLGGADEKALVAGKVVGAEVDVALEDELVLEEIGAALAEGVGAKVQQKKPKDRVELGAEKDLLLLLVAHHAQHVALPLGDDEHHRACQA